MTKTISPVRNVFGNLCLANKKNRPQAAGLYNRIISLDPVTLFETVDASARIDEFLLTGIKRVALRADFDPQFFSYRTGGECLSARAPHGAFAILRVNFLLQWFHLLPYPLIATAIITAIPVKSKHDLPIAESAENHSLNALRFREGSFDTKETRPLRPAEASQYWQEK
jgi:hypothetical protein